MKRRDFFRNTAFTALGASLLSPLQSTAGNRLIRKSLPSNVRRAKNIIFMVSDGMSMGTFNMANLLLQRKEDRLSNWLSLYEQNEATRALMDTASANSLVTD